LELVLQTSPEQALSHLSAQVTALRLPLVWPSIGSRVNLRAVVSDMGAFQKNRCGPPTLSAGFYAQ
jgi:hypothetical protein